MSDQQYILTRDGEEKFRGTNDQCFAKLLSLQSQSTHWAMKYEGWTISPVDPITRLPHPVEDYPLHLE